MPVEGKPPGTKGHSRRNQGGLSVPLASPGVCETPELKTTSPVSQRPGQRLQVRAPLAAEKTAF